MKARFLLFLLLLPFGLSAQFESMPFDAGKVVLNSDLIVYGRVRSDQGKTFKMEVIEVWHDNKYGIQPGNYLRVKDDVTLGCGFVTSVVEEVQFGIFFLTKEPSIWRLTHPEFLPKFNTDHASAWFNMCSYRGTKEEWRKEIQHFRSEFTVDKNEKVTGKLIAEQVKTDMSIPDLSLHYYLDLYPDLSMSRTSRLDCGAAVVKSETLGDPPPPAVDTTLHIFLEFPTEPPYRMDSLLAVASTYITEAHPILTEARIQGKVYCALIIERDGQVSRVEVLRSPHHSMDETVKEFFLASGTWSPGTNGRKHPIRSKITLPVKFGY